jgi:hypothetical protein
MNLEKSPIDRPTSQNCISKPKDENSGARKTEGCVPRWILLGDQLRWQFDVLGNLHATFLLNFANELRCLIPTN